MLAIFTYDQPESLEGLVLFTNQMYRAWEQRKVQGDKYQLRQAYCQHQIGMVADSKDGLRNAAAHYLDSIDLSPRFISFRGSRIIRPELERRGLYLRPSLYLPDGLCVAKRSKRKNHHFTAALKLSPITRAESADR